MVTLVDAELIKLRVLVESAFPNMTGTGSLGESNEGCCWCLEMCCTGKEAKEIGGLLVLDTCTLTMLCSIALSIQGEMSLLLMNGLLHVGGDGCLN